MVTLYPPDYERKSEMTIGIPSVYNAKHWLEILRRGTMQYDMYHRLLQEEMDKSGQTLEDVGTSEEELHDLLVTSCKAQANYLLGFLRDRDVTSREVFVRYIREELTKGGLAPEDIGTSQDELNKFLSSRV